MALVRLEGDYTGGEATRFVAALAGKLVGCVDLSGLLDDIQGEVDLDEEALRGILVGRLEGFARHEDEEILDWLIAHLVD